MAKRLPSHGGCAAGQRQARTDRRGVFAVWMPTPTPCNPHQNRPHTAGCETPQLLLPTSADPNCGWLPTPYCSNFGPKTLPSAPSRSHKAAAQPQQQNWHGQGSRDGRNIRFRFKPHRLEPKWLRIYIYIYTYTYVYIFVCLVCRGGFAQTLDLLKEAACSRGAQMSPGLACTAGMHAPEV